MKTCSPGIDGNSRLWSQAQARQDAFSDNALMHLYTQLLPAAEWENELQQGLVCAIRLTVRCVALETQMQCRVWCAFSYRLWGPANVQCWHRYYHTTVAQACVWRLARCESFP
jgi:hypothetical protein